MSVASILIVRPVASILIVRPVASILIVRPVASILIVRPVASILIVRPVASILQGELLQTSEESLPACDARWSCNKGLKIQYTDYNSNKPIEIPIY